MQKFILCIYVFLEKLKSMIQQHTHKTGLNMTCWSNEKGKNLKVWPTSNVPIFHTGIWPSPENILLNESKEWVLCSCGFFTCTVSHVQELASVWMQSCHVHSWELSFLLIASSCDPTVVSPVGTVNRFFLASVGLAVVIICIILRPEIEWSWYCLIFFFLNDSMHHQVWDHPSIACPYCWL